MRVGALLLLLAHAGGAAASASSSVTTYCTGTLPDGSPGLTRNRCYDVTLRTMLDEIAVSYYPYIDKVKNGTLPIDNSCPDFTETDINGRPKWGYETPYEMAAAYCNDVVCPQPARVDYRTECAEGVVHGFIQDFADLTYERNKVMWPVLFLIWSILLGASFEMCFPKWLPYTVGLLMFGMCLGALAQGLASNEDCPMYALKHDLDGNKEISRAEWNEFIGYQSEGSNSVQGSYCMDLHTYIKDENLKTAALGNFATILTDKIAYPSTCGDGTAEPKGCAWSFDDLDQPWQLSGMRAEYRISRGGGHRRLATVPDTNASSSTASSSTASGSQSNTLSYVDGDNVLSPDELWTVRCNFMMDLLSLKDMDPHVMLVVFLPGLLFESACFGVDLGIFRRQLSQIVIMAFPCMVIASLLVAVCLFALASRWSFWVCWLIGVIVSATDPVAVVALLKELGAAKTLGTLIEGESLLNDGSAVVLFTWVKNVIGYDYSTLAPTWMRDGDDLNIKYSGQIGVELLRILAQMLFWGVCIGLFFGVATKHLMRRVYNKRSVETCLVVGMSYFSFWVAEIIMSSSAVLSVIVMGLYTNANKSDISPKVLHFLHEFYEMVAHMLNTVIFLMAGCKLGALLLDPSFYDIYYNGGLSLVGALYPILLFGRGAAIALAFPLLKRLGTGLSWKEAIIVWWGGLRGSVGLALGLIVHHTMYDRQMWGDEKFYYWGDRKLDWPSLACRDQPQMVLFLTVLTVVLTVCINGITAAPIMRRLGMTDVPEERQFMLQGAKLRMEKDTKIEIANLKAMYGHICKEYDFEHTDYAKLTRMHEATCSVSDTDKATWLQVLHMERSAYAELFEHGLLSSEAHSVLEKFMAEVTARSQYMATDKLGVMYDKVFANFLKTCRKIQPRVAFEVGLAYLSAYAEVEEKLEEEDKLAQQAAEDAKGLNGSPERPELTRQMTSKMIDDSTRRTASMKKIKFEHEDNKEDVENMLQELHDTSDRADLEQFEREFVRSRVLLKQQAMIDHMEHEGELLDLDADPLRAEIDDQLGEVMLMSHLDRIRAAIKHAWRKKPSDGPCDGTTPARTEAAQPGTPGTAGSIEKATQECVADVEAPGTEEQGEQQSAGRRSWHVNRGRISGAMALGGLGGH